jgi:hypothetical protein
MGTRACTFKLTTLSGQLYGVDCNAIRVTSHARTVAVFLHIYLYISEAFKETLHARE